MNGNVFPSRTVFILQAARGPILLITIGVLFAMHEAGLLQFSRTWPLILIVLGVVKLLERLAMPQQVYTPPPPPQGPPPPYGQQQYPPAPPPTNMGGPRP